MMFPGYRPRRPWLRWFAVYCAVVLGLMALGLVIEAAVSPGPEQPLPALGTVSVPPLPGAGEASPAVTATPGTRPSTGPPALAGPVTVAAGRETVNGVELGFPHSTVGAVSAAADAAGEVFSTLDPDRAAAVMRLTADPSYTSAPQQAAQGAASDRQSLGIPAGGPVPAGYSLVIQPAEYQVRNVTADSALVLLLCDATTTRPGTGTQTRTAVFPFGMAWAAGDWKVASVGNGSYLNLAAEPFSPQAASLGWQELLPQEAASGS